jgi:hypothetical protein
LEEDLLVVEVAPVEDLAAEAALVVASAEVDLVVVVPEEAGSCTVNN